MFVFHYHIGVDMHWSYLESMTVSFVLYNQHMHKVQDTWHMLPHLYSSHNICYTYTSVSHYRLCGRIFQYITIKSIQIHIYPIYDTQLFKFLANSSFLCFASPFVPILLQYSHRGLNYQKKLPDSTIDFTLISFWSTSDSGFAITQKNAKYRISVAFNPSTMSLQWPGSSTPLSMVMWYFYKTFVRK